MELVSAASVSFVRRIQSAGRMSRSLTRESLTRQSLTRQWSCRKPNENAAHSKMAHRWVPTMCEGLGIMFRKVTVVLDGWSGVYGRRVVLCAAVRQCCGAGGMESRRGAVLLDTPHTRLYSCVRERCSAAGHTTHPPVLVCTGEVQCCWTHHLYS